MPRWSNWRALLGSGCLSGLNEAWEASDWIQCNAVKLASWKKGSEGIVRWLFGWVTPDIIREQRDKSN